jgi:hypothetical protein
VYHDLPLNHPLRHFYRGVAGVIGLAMLGFGVTGLRGHTLLPWFTSNLALAIVTVVVGVGLVVASLLWPHLSHLVYLGVGCALMTVGLIVLLLLRTADFFGVNMAGCLAALTAGLVVFLAGTYTRTGTAEEARNSELRRQGRQPAPPDPRPRPATTAQRRPAKTTPRRPASAR